MPTTVVHEVVPEEVLALERQPGGDMAVGGAKLSATFMGLDLIDEYWLHVNPLVVGGSTPMFPPSDTPLELQLVENRRFGNGVVLLRYSH